MINRVVKLSFDPAQVELFINLFKNTRNAIGSFEGCKGVRLLRDIHQPNIFFTYSQWESEQALEAYRHSELFKNTWAQTKQWFNDRPQAWSLSETFFDQV